MRTKEDRTARTARAATVPAPGVQVTHHSQFALAANYALRHDVRMVVPRMLIDREANRLEDHASPEPRLDGD